MSLKAAIVTDIMKKNLLNKGYVLTFMIMITIKEKNKLNTKLRLSNDIEKINKKYNEINHNYINNKNLLEKAQNGDILLNNKDYEKISTIINTVQTIDTVDYILENNVNKTRKRISENNLNFLFRNNIYNISDNIINNNMKNKQILINNDYLKKFIELELDYKLKIANLFNELLNIYIEFEIY